jgi:hypothetical protein
MHRRGALSDQAIRSRCPEWFAVSVASNTDTQPRRANKAFSGIKKPLDVKPHLKFSRFPLYDLQNFSALAAPTYAKQAFLQSVNMYRKEVSNSSSAVDYEDQILSTHTPSVKPVHVDPYRYAESVLSGSPTALNVSMTGGDDNDDYGNPDMEYNPSPQDLELGSKTRAEAIRTVQSALGRFRSRGTIVATTEAMIGNLVSDERFEDIYGVLQPYFPSKGLLAHEDAVSVLKSQYPSYTEIIDIADKAAHMRDVTPQGVLSGEE